MSAPQPEKVMITPEIAHAYPAPVWMLFQTTPYAGTLGANPGVLSARARTPASKAQLNIQVLVNEDKIEKACFQAYGCPFTIAVGSWLAAWCIGKKIRELSQFELATLQSALEIPADRAHCLLMAQDVLREIRNQLNL